YKITKEAIVLHEIGVILGAIGSFIIGFILVDAMVFDGGLSNSVMNTFIGWLRARHKRKMAELAHKQQLEIEAQRHAHQLALAEKSSDAIDRLMVDPDAARDFDKRLRIALSKAKSEGRIGPSSEELTAMAASAE